MTPQALLFTLSAIGISETTYLIRKHFMNEAPVCVIGDECHKVLESKYSKTFGVPNEVMGLVFYVVLSFLTAFIVIGVPPLSLWDAFAKIFIGAGTAMSAVFTYLQWRVVKAWCFWCLMSAATIFFMFIIVLINGLTITL